METKLPKSMKEPTSDNKPNSDIKKPAIAPKPKRPNSTIEKPTTIDTFLSQYIKKEQCPIKLDQSIENAIGECRSNQIKSKISTENPPELVFPAAVGIWSNVKSDMDIYSQWNWLSELFEMSERQLLNVYGTEFDRNTLDGFTLQEIEQTYNEQLLVKSNDGASISDNLRIIIVSGLDAIKLPTAKRAANSIVQVASQFNARVSPSKSARPSRTTHSIRVRAHV